MSQVGGPSHSAGQPASGPQAGAGGSSGGAGGDEALVVTGRLTWTKVLAWNSGIVIVGLGAIFALLNLVYGGLKENITDVKTRVDAIDQTLKVAIQSATSVQTLLTQTPKLEDRINATNDVVVRDIPVLRTKVDNIDKKTDDLVQAMRDVSQRVGAIQQGVDKLQGQVGNIQERLPRPR